VLKHVGEAGFARYFIAGPCPVTDLKCHERGIVLFEHDNLEPVRKPGLGSILEYLSGAKRRKLKNKEARSEQQEEAGSGERGTGSGEQAASSFEQTVKKRQAERPSPTLYSRFQLLISRFVLIFLHLFSSLLTSCFHILPHSSLSR
jgi:hypothetical protein